MTHFAKLSSDNIVIDVIVVADEHDLAWVIDWSGGYPHWKQTSYTGSIRKNYAGKGYSYDPQRDAFISPKPYPSWVLDEATCRWSAPIPHPADGQQYRWDETTQTWSLI